MITRNSLPEGYKPYQNLNVCSNTLIGGGHLVALGDVLPVLVGRGEIPKVWMQAPLDKSGAKYVLLVADSVAVHPTVVVTGNGPSLSVSVGGIPVLHVVQTSTDSAVVSQLDLRPIGLNISGNAASLNAGGANLSRNTFSGGGTLLAFGGGP